MKGADKLENLPANSIISRGTFVKGMGEKKWEPCPTVILNS